MNIFANKLRMTFIAVIVLVLCAACAHAAAKPAPAMRVAEKNGVLSVAGAPLGFAYDLKSGTFDVSDSAGVVLVRNAHSEVSLFANREKKVIVFDSDKKWSAKQSKGRFGDELKVTIESPAADGAPALRQVFRFIKGRQVLLLQIEISNTTGAPVSIERVLPVSVGGAGGGVFLSESPDTLRVLENGHKNLIDFWVRMVKAAGGSDSNWNSALHDTASRRTLVGGFLSQNFALGSIIITHDPAASTADPKSGRRSLTGYLARSAFSPLHEIAKGGTLAADMFALIYDAKSPHAALEYFASLAAIENKIDAKRLKRFTYWDTWYSHYVEDINEEVILSNLDAAARELVPYGLNTYMMDAGWEMNRGDWFENRQKFPHGLKYVTDRIRARGLLPAAWIAPFMSSVDSGVVKQHPDWFIQDMDTYGQNLMPKDVRALDISNPEAKKWLAETIRRITHDYGFDMLKVDFTYYSLSGKKYYQRGRTRVELFREAFRIMREAAGPDVYILAVGVPVCYHAGVVDAMRVALDNSPGWGAESGYAAQGTLPSYRALARRYYLNGKVWMNDPDITYTGLQSSFDRWNRPAQPRNELIAWISAVGLSGQMAEIADPPAEMDAAMLRLYRSVLPVYGASARPLDLFTRENPEVLDLAVSKPFGGWHVVGMFNWGQNIDLGPDAKSAAGDNAISALAPGVNSPGFRAEDLGLAPGAAYHVYDFWNDKYIGLFKGSYGTQLTPRTVQVVSVQPARGVPQFLATNRHITMGGTDIESIKWNNARKTLTGRQQAVAGFGYHLAFFIPDGFAFKSAKLSFGAARTTITNDGKILNLYFTPKKSGNVVWVVKFGKK